MKHREVDLHGLYTEEAAKDLYKHIFDLKNGRIDSILFITGKGTGALKTYVEDFLEKNELIWELRNNDGAFYVTCDQNRNTYYQNDPEDEHKKEIINDLFEEFKLN